MYSRMQISHKLQNFVNPFFAYSSHSKPLSSPPTSPSSIHQANVSLISVEADSNYTKMN